MPPTNPVKPNSCVEENQITSEAGEYHIWRLEIPTETKKPKLQQEQVQTNEEHLTKNKRTNGREEKKKGVEKERRRGEGRERGRERGGGRDRAGGGGKERGGGAGGRETETERQTERES